MSDPEHWKWYGTRLQPRVRLYISLSLHRALDMIASQEEFARISGFASSLIMVGWTIHILSLHDPKFLKEVKTMRALKQSTRMMSAMLGKTPGVRGYPIVKSYGRGRFITVSLSSGLLRMIQRYAIAVGSSRNEALGSFLLKGLKWYTDSKIMFQRLEPNLKSS